jgi:hypothetical protein
MESISEAATDQLRSSWNDWWRIRVHYIILHTTTSLPLLSLSLSLWWVQWPLWQSWASSSRYDPWRTRSIRRRRDEKPVWGARRKSFLHWKEGVLQLFSCTCSCCHVVTFSVGGTVDHQFPYSPRVKYGPNFGRQIGSIGNHLHRFAIAMIPYPRIRICRWDAKWRRS